MISEIICHFRYNPFVSKESPIIFCVQRWEVLAAVKRKFTGTVFRTMHAVNFDNYLPSDLTHRH
jgi:hypothetical protein